MATISAEKCANGTIAVFGHYSFGIVPLMVFASQEELSKFIILLQSCQVKQDVPQAFKKAFENP